MARRTLLIAYIATYLVAVGTIVRFLFRSPEDSFWSIVILLGVYLVLLIAEPFLIRWNRPLTYIYLIIQIAIISTLSFIMPDVDYWAALFLPIILQVMDNFTQRTGFAITGIITALMAVLMLLGPGMEVGFPLILINGVVYFFMAAFIAIVREAESAREESQKQQADLQSAYQQLQSYTTQAEELAVLEDRNRLARNLHDSVTQTIFSMRLTAEAARLLLDREPARVGEELDKLQSLAKSALAEMRSLIFELRPTAVTELGLIPALQHHIINLERQHSLVVDMRARGEPHLSDMESQRLYRIIQEALNNVVKHAQTDRATLDLRFEGDRVHLQVDDDGVGFEPEILTAGQDHIGLAGLQERVDTMGGILVIDSQPGHGTRVMVEVTSTGEEDIDG